jgi:hypothetical protein
MNRFNLLLVVLYNFLIFSLALKLSSNNDANREINNILVNDLNVIASKIDEIPETSLNIKLVLLAYECNDVKLNWKIGTSEKSSKFSSKKFSFDKSTTSSSKIFGYQIVVREIVDGSSDGSSSVSLGGKTVIKNDKFTFRKDSPYQSSSEKTMRVYSSKFIDSDQNKFKLINLLRRDQASYHICLIIYIDVTETVAFEKQCVNFSLPIVSLETEAACKAQKAKLSNPKSSSRTTTSKYVDEEEFVDESPFFKSANKKNKNITQKSNNNTNIINPRIPISPKYGNGGIDFNNNHPNCEHVSQCRYYSNLLTAFVVCGVLLGTNIFMFTIIIIQNTIKLNFLRKKLHYIKKYGHNNNNGTILSSSNTNRYTETGSSYFRSSICCLSYVFKWATDKTCSDVIQTVCLGNFKGNRIHSNQANQANQTNQAKIPPPRKRKMKLNKMEAENSTPSKNSKKNTNNDFSPGLDVGIVEKDCTRTITRSGYILQIPNTMAGISTSSLMNVSNSDVNSYFTRSTVFNNKISNNFLFRSKTNYKHRINPFQQEQEQTQEITTSQIPNKSDESLISTSYLDHDLTMGVEYDKEIFYHHKQSNNNDNITKSSELNQSEVSSAF